MSELKTLIIDDRPIEVDPRLTLFQACEQAQIEIPRFCYHERLSIAGNCRMCLVEIEGVPKPMASCALQVQDLRPNPDGSLPKIYTKSPMVSEARRGVLEFLLINHPLDCPICDQGGECDLQDQLVGYGDDFSRYSEQKRAHEEIYLGPLIKTAMTRCIHCTRCVRFITEVAGVPELGSTGRGGDAEIVSYLNKALTSELQGNIIDLCPVGALTSRPYAFSARPWELEKVESIDVSDALGANIRLDARGNQVMRILPRNNDQLNEEWISDKARFLVDGLRRQRLDHPYLRGGNGKLRQVSWQQAFSAIGRRLKKSTGKTVAALAGNQVNIEAMWALKLLINGLGSPHIDCRVGGGALPPNNPSSWLFNPTIEALDQADAILLIGVNPRHESAVLNSRIRRAWLRGASVGLIGEPVDLTYEYNHLGTDAQQLKNLNSNKFYKQLKKASHPLIILGEGALMRKDAASILALAQTTAEQVGAISDGWCGYGLLHHAAARVGGMSIGFVPGRGGKSWNDIIRGAAAGNIDLVYLLGVDEIKSGDLGNAFVIYQGSHGDQGAHIADVILPGSAFSEQSAIYLNMEGRPQLAERAVFPPGEAREDWAILRALAEELGISLPFNSLEELRTHLFSAHPAVGQIDQTPQTDWQAQKAKGSLNKSPFVRLIEDFYLTSPVTRASQTMAELSQLALDAGKRDTEVGQS